MANIVENLMKKGVTHAPGFMSNNIHYLTLMGSIAYGVAEELSDMDIYGFCIPPKHIVFPHTAGIIRGFGDQGENFEQYQQHHIKDPDGKDRIYDVSIYNIVKYFDLCMGCNPNMIDSLFTPGRCVLYITQLGQVVRENRKLFLSKKAWHTFKGYSFSQMHKVETKEHEGLDELIEFEKEHGISNTVEFNRLKFEINKRKLFDVGEVEAVGYLDNGLDHVKDEDLKKYYTLYANAVAHSNRSEKVKIMGCDLKFLYHVVRLLSEVEQILVEGDIELDRKAVREHCKAIRKGEVSLEEVNKWHNSKVNDLEKLYLSSTAVPYSPDENKIKKLLMDCLEMHFGDLSLVVAMPDASFDALRDIKKIVDKIIK